MSKSQYGKKVLKTVVRHRKCGTCNWWRRNKPGEKVRNHQCVRNHTGSARAMESVSGVQGIKEFADDGIPVEYLEGDGDNTMIARLKTDLDIDMKKRYDRNHVVKNVGKHLYALHNDKSVKLSKIAIVHIEKCLKYAFAKNQGDKTGMEKNLKALIPHQFGDHSMCTGYFCGYKRKQGEVYQHRSLPYKTALRDPDLRSKLQKIFDPLIANVEQYIDLGSSQQCEHANREVTLRAPKTHYYGNTKSLDYRVHATATFINEGRYYIAQANSAAQLSPGFHTLNYADKCQKKRLKKQEQMNLPATKRRRLVLKQERAVNQGAQETLEGVSYQTGIGHVTSPDIEVLPDAIPKGKFKPVKIQSGDPTFITFDLETTDLIRSGQMPHITQIAALEVKSGSSFNQYVFPTRPVASDAQRITGICVNSEGYMTVHGEQVDHVDIRKAVEYFCGWLNRFPNAVLIAHNGRRFDFPVLLSCLQAVDKTNEFFKCCFALIDSLTIFRKLYPKVSHKQEDLVSKLLGINYDAHNATADVESLKKLVQHTRMSSTELLHHCYSPVDVHNSLIFYREKAKNLPSLTCLVAFGICKLTTAENIAGSGLNMYHLQTIFKRSGEDGLRNIFTVKNTEGLPRVTNVKKVLDEVIPKLAAFFNK